MAARNTRWALFTFMNHFVTDAGFGLVPGAPPEMQVGAFRTLLSEGYEGYEGDWARARMHEVLMTQRMEFCAHDLELGFAYDGHAVLPDGTPAPPRAPMGDVYTPATRPGHRLPHAWLMRGVPRVSTHDLCGRGRFVLFTGVSDSVWQDAAQAATRRFGVLVAVFTVGAAGDVSDADAAWARLEQIDDGAVLVRPDGHVGWRVTRLPAEAMASLTQAIAHLLDRPAA